jgi:hypothetical protein
MIAMGMDFGGRSSAAGSSGTVWRAIVAAPVAMVSIPVELITMMGGMF